ncbi:MAG TPA: hypothetical protein VFP72_19020, partial [Kineosporiaceae bacterium]|nr:hypothetical protein [Kineosporiaceae bacterium]
MVDRAGVVVGQPLPVVEALVRDVSGWAGLFGAVEDVSRLGHDRYLVELRRGRRRTRAALVRVQWNASEHRFVWRTLNGPDWSGELRLTALTGRRTSVRLSFDGPLGHAGDPVPVPAGEVPGSGPQAQRPPRRAWPAGWRRLPFRRPGSGQARRDLQALSRR